MIRMVKKKFQTAEFIPLDKLGFVEYMLIHLEYQLMMIPLEKHTGQILVAMLADTIGSITYTVPNVGG